MSERLRATIQAVKPKFLQKCISFNEKIEDSYNPKLYTNIAVFVPKLSPNFLQPTIMVNISNGRSSCLMRAGTPLELKRHLQKIIDMLDTELFKERWERITELSENIYEHGELPLVYDTLYFKK
jgi:hypothetical protein